jgi:hypothetical protein
MQDCILKYCSTGTNSKRRIVTLTRKILDHPEVVGLIHAGPWCPAQPATALRGVEAGERLQARGEGPMTKLQPKRSSGLEIQTFKGELGNLYAVFQTVGSYHVLLKLTRGRQPSTAAARPMWATPANDGYRYGRRVKGKRCTGGAFVPIHIRLIYRRDG